MNAKNTARTALLIALALIFGYIETFIPLPFALPGIKLGFSNIVILFALMQIGKKNAFLILISKILVSALLFSGMSAIIYSLSGGILAYISMICAKKANMSVRGISACGAVFHNIGQVIAACLVLSSAAPLYMLPGLIAAGIAVGLITGTVCAVVSARLH